MEFLLDNFDFIKSVSLMYIVMQILSFAYSYNERNRNHINENKEMYRMIKDIHRNMAPQ